MRWRKVRAVLTFEFLHEVRRWPYIIFTFGMPVFLLAYAGFVGLFVKMVATSKDDVRIYGIVDAPRVLRLTGDVQQPSADIPPAIAEAMQAASDRQPLLGEVAWVGNIVFRPFEQESEALAALRAQHIAGYFSLAPDYIESGDVDSIVGEKRGIRASDVRRALTRLLTENLMNDTVPPDLAARIGKPIDGGRSLILKPDGSLAPYSTGARVAHVIVPMAMTILLFVSIMGGGQTLIQGTATEKENRVVEVLLSSANPEEILAGKLLGLGAAGLIQIVVWFGMAGIAALLAAAALTAMGVEIAWAPVIMAVPFFLAGYLFVGSLMLGTGSFGNNLKEGQQWALIWILLTSLPMIFLTFLLDAPGGAIAQALTWFPFSTPAIVIFRMSIPGAEIRWWEIAGSFLTLLGCTWLALKMGARLFRLGLLMTGSRPKLREILRQARLKA